VASPIDGTALLEKAGSALASPTPKAKRVLVTGGGGFIGSHVVDRLVTEGFKVGVLDNFVTGDRTNLSRHTANAVTIHETDIVDADAVEKVLRGYDMVVHNAALVSVTRSVEDPILVNGVNVSGTVNLLRAAVRSRVERFVYASSSSVYGDTETLPKDESMPTRPTSPYGVSKLSAESYCSAFAKVYGLRTVSLRYFNVFGPRQKAGLYSGVIPIFIRRVLDGKHPIIYGDGSQTRDFTFVSDVVEANLLALSNDNVLGGEVYNIAGGRTTSVNELASKVTLLLGRPDLVPEHVGARKGDILASYADVSRAGRELGYRPRTSLSDGLKETIEWVMNSETAAPGEKALATSLGRPRP